MSSKNITQGFTAPRSYWLAALCFAIGLAGCGGNSGGSGDDSDIDLAGDPPLAAVDRAARPGEVVLMQVGDEIDAQSVTGYSWTQIEGPPVRIGDPRRRHAHFLMPPVEINVELTFVVDIHRHDGSIDSEMHVVVCSGEPGEIDPTQPVITEQYVVFLADKDIDGRTDLYLSMLDGSALYRLNGNLTPGGDVNQFKISPDGQNVAYLADQEVDNRWQLYVATADGSNVARVSPDFQAGDFVDSFEWSPDGSMIGFEASRDGGFTTELFSNTPDGANLVRVSGDLVESGDVVGFRWSPTGALLAYLADQNIDGIRELFVSSNDGAQNYRVSEMSEVDQRVSSSFRWSPDGNAIAYAVFDDSENSADIFVVDNNGDNTRRVSHTPSSADEFLGTSVDWSPDGSSIAYEGYFSFFDTISNTSTFTERLFTASPDGSGATEVSALPVFFGQTRSISQYRWAPDGSRIIYLADQDTDNNRELYTSGPDGSGNIRISGPMVTGGDVLSGSLAWSPDSSLIAYRADQDVDNLVELYVADPLGGFNLKVSGEMQPEGDISSVRWSPDSSYLAYDADQRNEGVTELFGARPDGSSNLRLSGNLPSGGDVSGFEWASDGSRLVYRANQSDAELFELFVSAPDGSVVNARLSGTLTTGGDVLAFDTR